MADAYIVGVDMIKFGRFPEKTVPQLGSEAALLALDDCGLAIQDMQAFYCGNLGQASGMVGQRILQEIGQTGIPVVNVANACATGATAFREAWTSVKADLYDLVLAVGVEQMGRGLLGGGGGSRGISKEGLLGSGTMPSVFAEAGMEHTRAHGTTFEQFAKVSVKNHHHSTMNAKAMYQIETPLETVMNAEMISYPNTKLMCSVNVDGSAAAVIASEKKARELGLMDRAVKVRASVLTSDPWQERDLVMPDVNSCTRKAAAAAYEMAGLGPDDIDLIELHDCFATAEILHYENLGLCEDGEAGRLIDDGEVALGGRIPVNVSGGLLSKGHPLGATGIANIYEVSTHLRGCGRQTPGGRRAHRLDPRHRPRQRLRDPHPREGCVAAREPCGPYAPAFGPARPLHEDRRRQRHPQQPRQRARDRPAVQRRRGRPGRPHGRHHPGQDPRRVRWPRRPVLRRVRQQRCRARVAASQCRRARVRSCASRRWSSFGPPAASSSCTIRATWAGFPASTIWRCTGTPTWPVATAGAERWSTTRASARAI